MMVVSGSGSSEGWNSIVTEQAGPLESRPAIYGAPDPAINRRATIIYVPPGRRTRKWRISSIKKLLSSIVVPDLYRVLFLTITYTATVTPSAPVSQYGFQKPGHQGVGP